MNNSPDNKKKKTLGLSGSPGNSKQSKRSSGTSQSRNAQKSTRKQDIHDEKHQIRSKSLSPARMAAYKALRDVTTRGAYAQEAVSKHIDYSYLSGVDRAFATLLVLGVVSVRGVLDETILICLKSPTDVKEDVLDALRISTYELIYLDKEAHVVVHQGVELVGEIAPKAKGLANAVLRKVVKKAKEFPYGDPQKNKETYARYFGFPLWIVELLIKDLGMSEAHDFLRASNETTQIFLAVNPCSAYAKEAIELLVSHPESFAPLPQVGKNCFHVLRTRMVSDGRVVRLLNKGALLVSDASAQKIVWETLPSQKPTSFLEIGAGRGTKTILFQSASQLKYGSQIETYKTVDNLAFKCKVLSKRAEEAAVHLSEALCLDATQLPHELIEEGFDVVFVDAPCSGLGTLRKHADIRWNLSAQDIADLSELQFQMLCSASRCVNKTGRLVYSTCTVTQEENEQVIKRFLVSEEGRGFRVVSFSAEKTAEDDKTPPNLLYLKSRLVPGGPDAHFAVCLMRC